MIYYVLQVKLIYFNQFCGLILFKLSLLAKHNLKVREHPTEGPYVEVTFKKEKLC